MPLPDLVIFDCDGVLVDSEPISMSVLVEMVGQADASLSLDTAYRRFLGRSMATTAEILRDEFGIDLTDRLLEDMRVRLNDRIRRELRATPGVAAVVDRVPARRCVASSSKPERIRLSLEVTGLLGRFEPHIYSSTMVENGKPSPDLFLYAADAMGVEPRNCAVVEDSPAGIEAAHRAGMRVYAYVGATHAEPGNLRASAEAMSPNAIFEDMRDLPHLLAAAGAAE